MPADTNRAAAPVVADSSSGSVRMVSVAADFTALETAWNAMAALPEPLSAFGRHEWFDAAWQWGRHTASLYVLCFYASGRLGAVLPLALREGRVRGLRVRELTFLTVPDTQFCDIITAEAYRASATVAFATELARRAAEWDVMRLKYLATDAVAVFGLCTALKQSGFTTRVTTLPGNPFVRLDSSWAAYYATRSRRLKKANNLAANRLKRMGEIRVECLASESRDPTEVNRFLERAIAISARSWKRRTGNSLDQQGPQSFIRRLSELAAREGWLSLWIMSVRGRPLAMEYQLVAGGNVFALRSDFDAEFEDVSPGTHLNVCMLEGLFGRGLRRYYMGPGNNAYKHRWADEVEPLQELTVYGHSLAGRAAAAWETTIKPMAVSVRDRLLRSSGYQP